ncbi:replication factor A protein 3 [Blastocladiella britannica]|nr:replication factor A protein 3 [Blastocladiella britannica]
MATVTGADIPSTLRVNGAMLSQFVGKSVVLPGRLISNDGQRITVEAADNNNVNVILNQQLPVDARFLEITGVVEPDMSVQMTSVSTWPDTVDMELLNDTIRFQFEYSHLFQS